MKTAFVYALTLSLGIAAVSHAKTRLIELAPQETAENQELVQHTGQPCPFEFVGLRRHRMKPSVAYAPTYWSRWTV